LPNSVCEEADSPKADIKADPKDASTVILMRDAQDNTFEIFLARRHQRQSFMAGAFVFPGGQLDNQDCNPELFKFVRPVSGFDPRGLLQEYALSSEKAMGFFLAAIRETFEEAGIFFGGTSTGIFLPFTNSDLSKRFADYRQSLNKSQILLLDIIRKEKLLLFSDLLIPYSHWITPDIEKRRFSARFFLARLPNGQVPITDDDELTESIWVTPKKALEMHRAGKILLMPPTLKTIEEISLYSGIDELLAAAAKKTIYPILPQLTDGALILPHDPAYTIAAYKRPANLSEPSRFIIRDGIWKTAFYKNPACAG
jgi:8-oxo-dGTP pyrophosphatase MutT (NUDIX family)